MINASKEWTTTLIDKTFLLYVRCKLPVKEHDITF